MRVVEAFLSILLLFSALGLTTLISPESNTKDDTALASLGLQTLVAIDEDGHLGKLVDDANWNDIADLLNSLLPVGIAYNLTVYDENMHVFANSSISNALISDRNVVSVHYPCVSSTPQNRYFLLRLQLAVME